MSSAVVVEFISTGSVKTKIIAGAYLCISIRIQYRIAGKFRG